LRIFFDRGLKIAIKVQEKVGKLLKDFSAALEASKEMKELKEDVENFAKTFPMPG